MTKDPVVFYTTTMLAELLSTPVSTIRLLVRRGLLTPVNESEKILRFDSEDLLDARRLVDFMRAGFNTYEILDSVNKFREKFPDLDHVLEFITLTPDQKGLVFCHGEQGTDPHGQQILIFTHENTVEIAGEPSNTVTSALHRDAFVDIYKKFIPDGHSPLDFSQEDYDYIRRIIDNHILLLCESAWKLEGEGRALEALELYRSALFCGGSDPAICFQLAELLVRCGDLAAARERFYMTLELDRNNVEAQAELGHVLVLLGENEKAVEIYDSLLLKNPEFIDVHYDLGELLFRLNRKKEAAEHLRLYLNQAPNTENTKNALAMLEKINLSL